jgi:hypothetical protein
VPCTLAAALYEPVPPLRPSSNFACCAGQALPHTAPLPPAGCCTAALNCAAPRHGCTIPVCNRSPQHNAILLTTSITLPAGCCDTRLQHSTQHRSTCTAQPASMAASCAPVLPSHPAQANAHTDTAAGRVTGHPAHTAMYDGPHMCPQPSTRQNAQRTSWHLAAHSHTHQAEAKAKSRPPRRPAPRTSQPKPAQSTHHHTLTALPATSRTSHSPCTRRTSRSTGSARAAIQNGCHRLQPQLQAHPRHLLHLGSPAQISV